MFDSERRVTLCPRIVLRCSQPPPAFQMVMLPSAEPAALVQSVRQQQWRRSGALPPE